MKKRNCKMIYTIIILAISFIITGCSNEKTIEIQKETTSSNGIYTAYLYTFTNGGATVPFRKAISIIKTSEKNHEDILKSTEPNIYLNNNSNNDEIDINWEDDKNIEVNINESKENVDYIYLKVDIFNGININYK